MKSNLKFIFWLIYGFQALLIQNKMSIEGTRSYLILISFQTVCWKFHLLECVKITYRIHSEISNASDENLFLAFMMAHKIFEKCKFTPINEHSHEQFRLSKIFEPLNTPALIGVNRWRWHETNNKLPKWKSILIIYSM